jgi:hypothetical protein
MASVPPVPNPPSGSVSPAGQAALANLAPAQAAPVILAAAETGLDNSSLAALSSANTAAQDAATVARAAAATTVQAAQAVAVAADAVTAALAAAQTAMAAAPAPVQDAAGLGADATAKYLGAGFMGPPAGPVNTPASDQPEAVLAVPTTAALAANTYSNPQERSYGQAGAALSSPMVPPPSAAEGPELDMKI